MEILIEQAVFGEKDNGHALLNHTFPDSKTPNRIASKTDLPSGHTSFPSWEFFYSGITDNQHYVLLKTFPDHNARRSAFVYTYALFIKLEDVNKIKDLKHLFSLFPDEINKSLQLQTLKYETSAFQKISNPTDRVKKTAYGFLNEKRPVVWIGQNNFIKSISIIWTNLWSEARKNFQFRVSFGPKDIERTNEQIVYTPIGLKDKWRDYFTVGENDIFDLNYSDAVKYLVEGKKIALSITNLIDDLQVSLPSIRELIKIDLLNSFLERDNFDYLLNAIALLESLSPDKSSGNVLKEKLIQKINKCISKGNLQHILSLRNIKISHLPTSEPFQVPLNPLLEREVYDLKNFEFSEQLLFSIENPEVEAWWVKAIKQFFYKSFSVWSQKHSKLFWGLISNDYTVIDNIAKYIPKNKKTETSIAQQIPEDLSSDAVDALVKLANKRSWLILHAELIILQLSPVEAIESQLRIDTDDKNLEGLNIISKKIPAKVFIEYSITNPQPRLISLSVELSTDSVSLMNDIDLENSTWIEIWKERTLRKIDPFSGIKSPKKLLYKLLDKILKEDHVPASLLEPISKSKYADLSDYGGRAEIWNLLPDKSRVGFLSSTVKACLHKYLISPDSIQFEKEVKAEILFKNYVSEAIQRGTYHNENIISLFIEVESLTESLFLSFIELKYRTFNKQTCINLGNLLKQRNWSNTYKKVKREFVNYNSLFKETIKICAGKFPLIDSSLFNSLRGFFSSKPTKIQNSSMSHNNNQRITALILTAIDIEFKAVKSFLQNYSEEKHPMTGTIYGSGVYESIWNIKIAETEAGNNNAAIEAQRAIEYFKPKYVFFVGIAGGLKDVKIGDIVIASKVYGYESGKADEVYKPRLEFGQPSYEIKEIAKSLRKDDQWLKEISSLISDEIGKRVKINAHFKPIAAGEKVISSTKSDIYKFIKQNAGDSLAVEMEGYGFLKACYAYTNINYILIRGISDLVDNKSQTDGEGGQELASLTASAFTFEMLSRIERERKGL